MLYPGLAEWLLEWDKLKPTRYLNKYKKKTQSKATFGLLSLHSLLVNIGVEAKLCSSVAAETA